MAVTRTFSIIKPDATRRNLTGAVNAVIEKAGLRILAGRDFEVVNPESDSRYKELWQGYHEIMGRQGVTPGIAKQMLRSDTTLIGASTSKTPTL